MKIFNYFFIITIISALMACSPRGDKALYIEKIDSLLKVVESVDSIIMNTDRDRISESYSRYEVTARDFGKYFNDEVDSNWTTITAYGEFRKPFRNFLRAYDDYLKEIEYTNKQLNSFKESIIAGAIPADSIDYYLHSESEAVQMLEQSLKFTVNDAVSELDRFDSLHPLMLNLLEIYRAINPEGKHINVRE